MGKISSVEDVVLEHEEDVKEDGEEAETELGRVAKDARPVVVVVSDQDHLQGEVEVFEDQQITIMTWMMERLPPVKSRSIFPMLQPTVLFRRKFMYACGTYLPLRMSNILMTGIRWWSFHPLYDCDPQFDIGEVVEHVQPGDDADSGQDEGGRDEDGDAQQDRQAPLRHTLVAPLEDEALKQQWCEDILFRCFFPWSFLADLKDSDGGGEDCMDGKEDIRRCDRKNSSRVLRVIFSLQPHIPISWPGSFSVVMW